MSKIEFKDADEKYYPFNLEYNDKSRELLSQFF